MILVDTSILFDVLNDDPNWADWSQAALESALGTRPTIINDIIYADLSGGSTPSIADAAVAGLGLQHAA